ncbi:AAA family ATPase [Candidatus Pacearchaeota archaeon]|nr:AAA family ATPase [Candidatus Pacearchaeota archaeon]
MKLIFVYGPPASGKLTVSKELSKITGYKLFHNMLTVDLAQTVLDWNDKNFGDLTTKYRLITFEEAAKANVEGIIFTYAYAPGVDDDFVKKVINQMKSHNGEIHFVQIHAEKEELLKRVESDSRKELKKLIDKSVLEKQLVKRDQYAKIPFVETFSVDTTCVSAKETAEKIKEHFKLVSD